MKPKKPTPEQRAIINAIRWCKRNTDKEIFVAGAYRCVKHGLFTGYGPCPACIAYDHCADYLNKKLPKGLRVKI